MTYFKEVEVKENKDESLKPKANITAKHRSNKDSGIIHGSVP